MRTRLINEEVLFADDRFVSVDRQEIQLLKSKASQVPRERIRLCTHSGEDDLVHEMLIVHTAGTYVRPHRHLGKSESYHVIEGAFDFISFDDNGHVVQVIQMGDYSSGKAFYHRSADEAYHTLLIRSDVAVFHETTKGPFRRSDTVFPPWSPELDDGIGMTEYMERLAQAVSAWGATPRSND